MKKILFLFLLLFLPHLSIGAEMRTLEVELSFSITEFPDKQLLGYRLFKEGEQVCETADPLASKITCDFLTEDGTFNFTLTAYYSDDSKSPPSPSFRFTVGSLPPVTTDPPPAPSGTKFFTYTWETRASPVELTGYKMYMNSNFLCETDDPNTNTLTCKGDLINAPMTFSMKSVDINGAESLMSNFLELDPADFPELFLNNKLIFNWNYTDGPTNAGGFRIFDNGELICETAESSIRQLTCENVIAIGSHLFSMVAIDANGIETAISNALTYSNSTTTETPSPEVPPVAEPLHAIIDPTPVSGEAPISISFSGAGSTGDISTFSWLFGDGTTGSGSTVSHSYSIEAAYTVTLRIADLDGTVDETTTTITILPGTTTPEPPVAILSSTAAVGNAPLQVDFNGSLSTTPNPPMLSYSWAFGDSSVASGETASHAFTTTGTYHTELTVADSLSLTDKVDTPVIVTGITIPNINPVAVATAGPLSGEPPLAVSFSGALSVDTDGSISQYNWNFGDGTTGSGQTVQHTYTSPANYNVSLQVVDDNGQTGFATIEIACGAELAETEINFEVGEVSLDQETVKILFENSYNDPIVIAGPPVTVNEDEPVLIRISNVDQEGFDIRLQEWDYQDSIHTPETFSYIVIEQGIFTLEDGTKVEAGKFAGSTSFTKISLQQSYTVSPVILTQVVTENERDAVTDRIQKIDQTSFEYKLQEQETTKNSHTSETINYIAWEPGKGDLSGLLFETGMTTKSVTHGWFDLTFQTTFPDVPLVIAGMQTYAGRDSAAVRAQSMSQTAIQIKIEEEQSKDTELDHAAEVVGYLIIGGAAEPDEPATSADKQFTFTWEYSGDTQDISGFRFYLNNSLLCETIDPDATEITCIAAMLNDTMEFSMTSVSFDGTEESTSTNILSISPENNPDLFGIRLITYVWEFDANMEDTISGFRVYNGEQLVCETIAPADREISCETATSSSDNKFTIKAIELSGSETSPSNAILYSP